MALDIDLSELTLGSFDSRTRLHPGSDGPLGKMLAETWCNREALNDSSDILITALSEKARASKTTSRMSSPSASLPSSRAS